MKRNYVIIFLAIAFGLTRLTIHPSTPDLIDVYKDIVHVFMGVIGTLGWQGDKTCKWVFWLLSVLEVSVAVISRM